MQFGSHVTGSPALQAELAAYARRLPGVTGVQVTGERGNAVRIDLRYQPDPLSAQARQIAQRVRGVPAPPGSSVAVGGQSAQLVDELSNLAGTVPWMALAMAAAAAFASTTETASGIEARTRWLWLHVSWQRANGDQS